MWSSDTVVNVTNSAIAQITAKPDSVSGVGDAKLTPITGLNDTEIIDLGEKLNISSGVVTNGSPADCFVKALMCQIGKVIVDKREYVKQLPKMYKDTHEFGLITEMIKIDMLGDDCVLIDEMLNPLGFVNDYTITSHKGGSAEGERIAGIEFGNYLPKVHTKLFKKCTSIMVALTEQREALKFAFQNAEQFTNFFSGLMVAMKNTIAAKAEAYALMCLAVGIGKAHVNGNEIDILAEYNDFYGITGTAYEQTASTALAEPKFLKFLLMRMVNVKDNMRRYTAAYNNHETMTFSADPHVVLLSQVANACKFNVLADTYHEELLGIGDYQKITAFQGLVDSTNTEPFNFKSASTVSFTLDATKEIEGDSTETNALSVTGVIGVVYDDYAMGVLIDKQKTTSTYSAVKDSVNYFNHHAVDIAVNDAYSIVTFVLKDKPVTP